MRILIAFLLLTCRLPAQMSLSVVASPPGIMPASSEFIRYGSVPFSTDYKSVAPNDATLILAKDYPDGAVTFVYGHRLVKTNMIWANSDKLQIVVPMWKSDERMLDPRNYGRGFNLTAEGIPHFAMSMEPVLPPVPYTTVYATHFSYRFNMSVYLKIKNPLDASWFKFLHFSHDAAYERSERVFPWSVFKDSYLQTEYFWTL